MSKKVIINADDFGIAEGVNRGIAECHLNGVLNSASLLVNMPGTKDAAELSQKMPGLKIGLHISLIGGQPVSRKEEVPFLVNENGFFPKRGIDFIRKLVYTGTRMLKDVTREIRAQIELMKQFGLKIEHIDSHDHIHIFPSIMEIVIKLAKEYRIPRIRYPNQKVSYAANNFSQYFKGFLLSVLSSFSRNKLHKSGIAVCDHCWGLAESGNLNERALTAILRVLPEGLNEIMCHPGYVDRDLLEVFPVIYNWEEETKALTSSRVKTLMNDCGIELM